jgi:hypothetical protein
MSRDYYMDDSDLDGVFSKAHVAGPLVGGGVTQAVSLGTKLLFKSKPKVVKWAPLIGLAIGGGLSGVLAARASTRETGIAGLITALLIAVPDQVERLVGDASASTAGYLGIITPEREMNGYFGEYDDDQMMGLGAQDDIQLLGASPGTMGIITPEREMAGAFGADAQSDVELLGSGDGFGSGGFGSNFLSQM